MKAILTAFLLLSLVGCRAVQSSSTVSNTFTAGNDVVLNNSGTEGLQETTQAADKKLGDIAPELSTAVGPAAKSSTTK